MNYNKLMVLTLAASVVLMGCKENVPSSTSLEEAAAKEKVSFKLTAQESAQVDASNALGLDVLRDLVTQEPEKSTVVSPSGIRYNLSISCTFSFIFSVTFSMVISSINIVLCITTPP